MRIWGTCSKMNETETFPHLIVQPLKLAAQGEMQAILLSSLLCTCRPMDCCSCSLRVFYFCYSHCSAVNFKRHDMINAARSCSEVIRPHKRFELSFISRYYPKNRYNRWRARLQGKYGTVLEKSSRLSAALLIESNSIKASILFVIET